MNDKLVMTFEANTIKHLGVKMYSTMPPALAELIANAYDACATEVHVKLYDDINKKVIIEDNGTGMSFKQVNDYFLRIGRIGERKIKDLNVEGFQLEKKD